MKSYIPDPVDAGNTGRENNKSEGGGGGGSMETMVQSARSHETFELITGENELGEASEYLLPHYCSSL